MPNPPPTGTVSFLFTDIEGSTRLAQAHPAAWPALQARHHAILRAAFESHGGYIFQIIGDAFCVAFSTASDALQASLTAQRALHAEVWGETPIRVRMGLHTGAVETHGDEYHGYLTLSRVQRIMSAGHGGQVLLSQAAADLVSEHLPVDITLRDLGRQRLKDLNSSERLFQLIAPDLPRQFASLKSLDARPNNLPIQATPFIGRETDMRALHQTLARSDVRLLTITGAGGTGKTRLALQAAADMLDEFADGVWLVTLAPVSQPDLVVPAIAHALSIRESAGSLLLDSLKEVLRDQQLLLLLDNFEQVITAAPAIAELLDRAPRIKVMVTSRELLRVYGEHAYPVTPLDIPNLQQLPPLEQLTQIESVRLFSERARAVQPDFAVSSENAQAVAAICNRLDGLPLAIELAAARVRLLPPQKMLAQLDNRLRFLTGGARDLPARQQTLRGAIDWSHALLTDGEKRLFRQLSVFVGGCTLEAAESVCDLSLQPELLTDLQSLLDKNLIRQNELTSEPRFSMLETIREYAQEQLARADEWEQIKARHLTYFLALAESAEPFLKHREQVAWLNRLETEHDNLREALRWSVRGSDHHAEALRLAGALAIFWDDHSHYREGLQHLHAALGAPGASDQAARAKALHGAALLAFDTGDYAAVRSLGARSIAACRTLGPGGRRSIANTTRLLGYLESEVGDYATAMTRITEALRMMRELNDSAGTAETLRDLGTCLVRMGDFEAASARLQEALAIFQQQENSYDAAVVLTGLAEIALRGGDYARAAALEQRSLAVRREIGNEWGIAVSLGNFAWILLRQGDLEAAAQRLSESSKLRRKIGDKGGLAWCLEKMSEVAMLAARRDSAARPTENVRRAVRLLGAAAGLRAPSGSTIDLADRPAYQRQWDELHAILDAAAFAGLWAEGQSMTLEQALKESEAVTASTHFSVPPAAAAAIPPGGLTDREAQVLHWLARGLTDAQIAETLVVSVRTVNSHLRSIYGKLGVTSRTEAVRVALSHPE